MNIILEKKKSKVKKAKSPEAKKRAICISNCLKKKRPSCKKVKGAGKKTCNNNISKKCRVSCPSKKKK
jgi:hypothetical protein